MEKNYIDCKTFADFKKNQEQLIQVLNHNITKMKNDVSWLKSLTAIQLGVIITCAAGIVIGAIIK